MRSHMTTQANPSPRVGQLSLLFLMFVLSSPVAAEQTATPMAKPDAPAFTAGPAVPLSAAQRAALVTKRAATVTGTPARLTAIVQTKPSPFSFTGGPVGGVVMKSLPASEPAIGPEADVVEALFRAQGRGAVAEAGLLKSVAGRDELAKPASIAPQAAPRTSQQRPANSSAVRTMRSRGGR